MGYRLFMVDKTITEFLDKFYEEQKKEHIHVIVKPQSEKRIREIMAYEYGGWKDPQFIALVLVREVGLNIPVNELTEMIENGETYQDILIANETRCPICGSYGTLDYVNNGFVDNEHTEIVLQCPKCGLV